MPRRHASQSRTPPRAQLRPSNLRLQILQRRLAAGMEDERRVQTDVLYGRQCVFRGSVGLCCERGVRAEEVTV